MRADARANHVRLLVVAGAVITEQGVDASMRDIARQAGVGLATLLRHFPTREALLEALLRTSFDELTARAAEVETSSLPQDALMLWLRDFVACTTNYRGVATSMMRAIEDPQSALHTSCVTMRAAGTRLLTRAQAADVARTDLDGADLFALASSLAWLGDMPGLEARAEHLFGVVMSAILTNADSSDTEEERRPRARS
ncbi:TetR/AcrR family transcriptional regulator [Candidatus Frankia alpina]|uniref:TetR/AcrR family transcriptional regulator n=1 Tax=Candidatus Frankia alpina TaxID=2699483 RepID=A0A4S5BVJ8_9ACTN|nr:TetR/AcrR family transcriptional regulator [Candidatus Frankia alpina]THJ36750.1 TetR/AcrR family transcriptional regulator [Candidatus Frankia alpina]